MMTRSLLWLMGFMIVVPCRADVVDEDTANELKAAYIFHFTKFISFPEGRFTDPESPVVIGVYGDHVVMEHLTSLTRGKKAKSRPIQIVKVGSLEEASRTHLLYLPNAEGDREIELLSELKGTAVLTIVDAKRSKARDGMIQFLIERGKVRFKGNIKRIREEEIKVDSKLIKLMR